VADIFCRCLFIIRDGMSKDWMWVLFIICSFKKYEDDGDLHEEGMSVQAEILNQDLVQVGEVEVFHLGQSSKPTQLGTISEANNGPK
jgi:hypothetical protein